MTANEIKKILRAQANPVIAEHSQRFFKTGKGEYGDDDKFLGIRVPVLRKLVRQCKATSLKQTLNLLKSAFHEERLFALLLLVDKFKHANADEQKTIYEKYLDNSKFINNWDLVDSSASQIIGAYLQNKDKQPLYQLAKSNSLWQRRIAIIASFHLIRQNQFDESLSIATLLLNDKEDLIHKAVGWMLREIGKRDLAAEKAFLDQHYQQIPRTMLRYAIEKFPEKQRKHYLGSPCSNSKAIKNKRYC